MKQKKAVEVTKSGLFIPSNAQEKMLEGEVLAVGPGKTLDNGTVLAPSVKVGDVVMFPEHSYAEVSVDDEDYLIIDDANILAIIDQ
jgi:chaperonin GroES